MIFKEITPEDMAKAKDYIPITEKERFVLTVAPNCMDKLLVTASYDEDNNKALPNMYKENTFIKSMYLMGALLTFYFGIDYDHIGEDEWLITADEYDRFMGGHIFDQIQQYKGNKDTRDKAFQILADYKDLESRLNREIQGMLAAQNDPVSRALMALTKQIDPSEMEKMLSDLDAQQKALEDYVANRKANAAEAVMTEA